MNREGLKSEDNKEVDIAWQEIVDGAQMEVFEEHEAVVGPAERYFLQNVGRNVLAKVNTTEAQAHVEVTEDFESSDGEPIQVEVMPSVENIMTDLNERLDMIAIEDLGVEYELQTEVLQDEANEKGLLSGLRSKIRQAIGKSLKNPRSVVAALAAATALGGAISSAKAVTTNQLTAIETEVKGIDYNAQKTSTIEKNAKNKVELIDSGTTEQEVIDAMDGLQYRVYAEFNEDGQKIFEGTQYKRSSVPRPGKLGSTKGHTMITNKVNTNRTFSDSDINNAANYDVNKVVLVTDDYVFTLGKAGKEWPDSNEIFDAYKIAKKEVAAEARATKKNDPERLSIISDNHNQIINRTTEILKLDYTVVNKADENSAAKIDESKNHLSRNTEKFDFTDHGDNIYDWMKNAHTEPYEVAASFTIVDGVRTKILDYTSYSAGRVSQSLEAQQTAKEIKSQGLPTIHLHTHPTSSNAFSNTDISSFLSRNNVATIVVTRKQVYMLARDNPEQFSNEEIEQVKADYAQEFTAAARKAAKIRLDGERLSEEERSSYASTKASQKIADKYGFYFNRHPINSVIPDKNGNIDPTLAREIEEIFNHAQANN